MSKSTFHIEPTANADVIAIRGPLDLAHVTKLRNYLKPLPNVKMLDLGGLTRLDTAGAMVLLQLSKKHITFQNLHEQHHALYDLLAGVTLPRHKARAHHPAGVAILMRLGQGMVGAVRVAAELVTFIGQAALALGGVVAHPKRLRMGEITHHIEQIGINAIPIIALVAFLISVVLAYQSSEQLRPLGAQKFTVDLITISVLREMGVLLTAIMVAGRSGSAFTAEIGVMKIREEVDALKAIGVDPFELLVVPRLIAIIIALPLLTFIGNMMGLLGGAVLTKLLIGMPFDQYAERVHTVASNGHALLVGMIKAPVFGFFIGIVGCMHGMQVSGSAESVGTRTTTSVVQSIFLVLVLDALFSVFFQQVGI